jgi:hypothetical protein
LDKAVKTRLSMNPIKPIQPIGAIRAIREATLRRVPSVGQLRLWLAFARQKSRKTKAPLPRLTSAQVADPPADEQSDDGAAGQSHIDKRA